MSNELWNLHCTHTTDEESDFDTVTEWAANYIVHLETQLAALKGITAFIPNNAASNIQSGALKQRGERCSCGDRNKADCPGEWEQGCNLGSNEKYVAVAPTIPEGWQEFIESCAGLRAKTDAGENVKTIWLVVEAAKSLIAAAPKPEE